MCYCASPILAPIIRYTYLKMTLEALIVVFSYSEMFGSL